MTDPTHARCRNCRALLEERHRFCWRCGLPRVEPPPAPTAPSQPELGSPSLATIATLRGVGLVYSAGAIFFLIMLAQTAAHVLAPNGRAQLIAIAEQAGVAPDSQGLFVTIYGLGLVLAEVVGAVLHGVAYYTLRRRRLAGWAVAVVLAELWSVLLLGIPLLLILLRRDVRAEFGLRD